MDDTDKILNALVRIKPAMNEYAVAVADVAQAGAAFWKAVDNFHMGPLTAKKRHYLRYRRMMERGRKP